MRNRILSLAILMLAAGCAAPGSTALPSGADSAGRASTLPPATATESPDVPASPTGTPVPEGPRLAVDYFADVVTTDLVVRSRPGTGGDSEILGVLADEPIFPAELPWPAYVLDGPVEADRYEWWLVVPYGYGMLGGDPAGWVAAGDAEETWLAPTNQTCDDEPTSDWQEAMWPRVCPIGTDQTLADGMLTGCQEGPTGPHPTAWPQSCWFKYCEAQGECLDYVDGYATVVHFEPPLAERYADRRIRLSGHFDDAAAEGCAAEGDALARLYVFDCRRHFVVTSYRFVD